jgi:ribosome-associated protein
MLKLAGSRASRPARLVSALAVSTPAVIATAITTATARKKTQMIQVTETIALDEEEIEESFIRASGPGGQNVNKVASAVQLRFDARHSHSLPQPVRQRLEKLAGNRLTQDGVLVITAQRFRSQERNRQDALERLLGLIRRAMAPPRPRRPTRPSAAARERRLADKARRSRLKRVRKAMPDEETG